MCLPGDQPGFPASAPANAPAGVPSSAAEALAGLEASLGYLAGADVADWPAEALAGCLRALGRAESAQVAARSKAMAAFNAQGGFEADGQSTIRAWLRWQTQTTRGGAGAAADWMKRLAVHPRVLAALAAAQVTVSFARLICDASDMLPPELRDEADEILLAAAAGGATEADLVMLAQEMRERSAAPDTDGPDGDGDEDGFTDRRVQLDVHFRGRGKLDGDLTPECTAAVAALLEALGKKAGPEDTRTEGQRGHDALEEAARRLIAGGLPDTAGQPTQVQLHMTLDQLRDLPGAADAERTWAAARAAADGTPGWVYSRAAAEALRLRRAAGTGGDRAPGPRRPRRSHRPVPRRARPPGLRMRGLHLPARAGRAAATRAPHPAPPAEHPARLRGRRPVRAGRPRRVPAHRAARRRVPRHREPAAGHRDRDRGRAAAPAPRGHLAGPALRVPRLPPQARLVPSPSPGPPRSGRRDGAAQPGFTVLVPPPDRRAPLGLGPRPESRRHHHRHQPRRQADLPQPRATRRGLSLDELAAIQ
jgi:hypothetical protein